MTSRTQQPAVTFRAMRITDVPDIIAIEREAFTTPWTAEAFINELTHNHFAKYIVMEDHTGIIGYGGMWTIIDEAHVTNIAVRHDRRGMGLGEKMLQRQMENATEYGMQRMTLEVRVSNDRAQRLYERLGFEPAGIRPGYYSDNNEDALIMWVELHASETEEQAW
ncbi:ribosomal-protein-alanine N-acetyltransferase [Paenibacillus cellulosilyticus]|uniref:Ribosomal-protein-alanine N-acetyltransferase n=1 Tax=Paenibacillus cellulosilyticus TaxID=375489 RepID=A0A2V2YL01_9BACL|nr:ribosomal protein S18-alanine N-acetyltransferase [Paenibacillus cellulosilyticus]PWV93770.1 ribosomal-protein-alanine N-acetyltransferase [Paenibacillus cellulosilyticus]QKS47393.1 ribosomal protein S18-alanine N-acetyltransferase [Paenibacillus cellulosilyticus]